ncbi:hypothetical protein B0H15DRAFT_804730 [Mycena belliarum]|uniref:DUF6699 domain-containing protein n=1 Tax=Mycena belliarum TaxID=1033014 RepID=A0AAD6TVC7_9AGAR|nr:hypothetical protein B0H15DRAFT_804730 [Mycena belliae]
MSRISDSTTVAVLNQVLTPGHIPPYLALDFSLPSACHRAALSETGRRSVLNRPAFTAQARITSITIRITIPGTDQELYRCMARRDVDLTVGNILEAIAKELRWYMDITTMNSISVFISDSDIRNHRHRRLSTVKECTKDFRLDSEAQSAIDKEEFLIRRVDALKGHVLFAGLERFEDEPNVWNVKLEHLSRYGNV